MRYVSAGLTFAMCLAVTGCGDDATDERVVVSAASSFVDRFSANRETLSLTNPDLLIDLNFAGSTTLVNQINAGAPVDVLAVADRISAEALEVDVHDEAAIGSSTLHVVRHADAPVFGSLDQLAESDVLIAACDESLPCGRLTQLVLEQTGFEDRLEIDVRDANVRAVLGRVERGEADYGFVYDTEIEGLASDAVEAPIVLPDDVTNERVLLLLSLDDAAQTTFRELRRLERRGILFTEE